MTKGIKETVNIQDFTKLNIVLGTTIGYRILRESQNYIYFMNNYILEN